MERMFLTRDSKFIILFFDNWALQDIISLGKVNRRCHQNPQHLMYMLSEEQHVLFGPAIFSFFDRRPFQAWPIDICIHVDSMGRFMTWLKKERFIYADGPSGIASFETAVLGELIRTPDVKLKSTGDRNSAEADRAAWGPYIFAKDASQLCRIKVYVVRCEPYRHVMSLRANWKVHKASCRQNRAGAGVLGWENAAMKFNNDYGNYAGTYAIGTVFRLSGTVGFEIPSHRKWKDIWHAYVCIVELQLVREEDQRGNITFKSRFLGAYPAKVEDYLHHRRLKNYRKSVDSLDWPVGVLLVSVLEPNGPFVNIVTAVRPLSKDDLVPPAVFIANMSKVYCLLRILAISKGSHLTQPQSPSSMQPLCSNFELILLKGDVSLILYLFDSWGPREIFTLSATNRRLYSIVRLYTRTRWNVKALIGRFTQHPSALLKLLNEGDGIIFGPAVTKFFDRTLNHPSIIDICLHGRLLENLLTFLEEEGYSYAGWNKRAINLEHYLWSKYAGTPTHELVSSGERNHDEAHRSAWGPYEFSRHAREETRRINLHIVRCEPYRHLLSMHSTGLMNMIAWNRAIALFPTSTFIYRRSFVSAQDSVPAKQHNSDYKIWFDSYATTRKINIVGLTHKVYNHVEIGQRFVGDHHCWIIPFFKDDETPSIRRKAEGLDGLAFEALDWRSGSTRTDSYLRLGEPRIWR
ncbi:hypothetical protein CVT26_013947 [Gymnopilus dilepis]|uniref:F-box domain-containing protein n=1 Tax=Gymnopilus dilepis TaxID=231916 RepID=A0A409WDR7_9AGAR|nr:hypothetical protein CVT26_013947 [Gymnopilus dilepis]